jgi:hypothetical protein
VTRDDEHQLPRVNDPVRSVPCFPRQRGAGVLSARTIGRVSRQVNDLASRPASP